MKSTNMFTEIAHRTRRVMTHEAGHALTADQYGFGANEFLIEVFNDRTGATYKGRVALRFITDAEITAMDEGGKRCYGVVCAGRSNRRSHCYW